MTRAILLCCALAALPARPASAREAGTPARELTADESVRLGLERNARLRAAAAEASAAGALARQARAARLPTVRTQAGFTRLSGNIPDVTFTLPGAEEVTLQRVPLSRYQAEVTAEHALFTGSRVKNEVRAAEHEATAAERRARQEDAAVALEIRNAFWELHRARAAREALEAAGARVEAHLAEVGSRVREGAALQRDLLSAQTRRSEVRLERLEADNAVRVAELELDRLVGLPLDTPLRPVGEVTVEAPEPAPEAAAEALTAAALAGRPDLAALAEEVSALRARRRAAEGERWPRLDVVGRYVQAQPNPYFFVDQDRFHWNWELGLTARWNVFEGGRRRARESELSARVEAAEARLADARARVAVEVARRQLEVARATEAVAVAAQNVTEAEETWRVARRQFQEGAARSADVLDAEEAYRRAEARRAQASADYARAKAAVLGALGQVW